MIQANKIEQYLKKEKKDFTKEDLIKFIEDNKIEIINFRYIAEDDHLKTLSFYIYDSNYLDTILTYGERVDGSSLFSFIDANSSDLYVIPRYRTAFVNPFSEIPAVDILCSFYTSDGKPLESSPEYILQKAYNFFKQKTGLTFKAFAELEFYLYMYPSNEFILSNRKGYHESEPYIKMAHIRNKAMKLISECGGKIKYGHSEVGAFTDDNYTYEQHEIEFLPVDVEEVAEQFYIAKWILRTICYEEGVKISFAPKITIGKAGSGLHIHMLAEKEGKNVFLENGKLSDIARKMIAGILTNADALTAFGNTTPLSYFRLVPNQEAPTNVCWGDRNRSTLIRVPLGWTTKIDMAAHANTGQEVWYSKSPEKQTFELRSPDATANIYLLLAGILISVVNGLEMPDALEIAQQLYVDVNIHKEGCKSVLSQIGNLPDSCFEAALALEHKRHVFEQHGIFPTGLISSIINKLKSYNDKDLRKELEKDMLKFKEYVESNL